MVKMIFKDDKIIKYLEILIFPNIYYDNLEFKDF